MTKCKICSFFNKGRGKYKVAEKERFRKLIAEGKSLSRLEQYLDDACSFKVSKETIRQHFNHMDTDITKQRKIEQENKGLKKKLRNIFSRPKIAEDKPCPHLRVQSYWSISEECVRCKCVDCGKVLEGFSDPNTNSRRKKRYRDYKSATILEAFS